MRLTQMHKMYYQMDIGINWCHDFKQVMQLESIEACFDQHNSKHM